MDSLFIWLLILEVYISCYGHYMVVIGRFWTSGLFVYILDNRPLFGSINLIIVDRLIVPTLPTYMGIPNRPMVEWPTSPAVQIGRYRTDSTIFLIDRSVIYADWNNSLSFVMTIRGTKFYVFGPRLDKAEGRHNCRHASVCSICLSFVCLFVYICFFLYAGYGSQWPRNLISGLLWDMRKN